jgi:FkbM family methyltransferase
MQPAQSSVTTLLKQILFRPIIKHPRLQRFWSQLHTVAIFAMNYGGGGLIESSGEQWVLAQVVSKVCQGVREPLIFDVGANVGDYSLMVRELVPAATVFAFEPSGAVYQELERRLAAAGQAANVKAFNLGFSDTKREVALHSYTADGNEASLLSSIDLRLPTQVVAVEAVATEQIDVDTLDHFCEAHDVTQIHFLKLDVEGHELAILQGAQRLLAQGAIAMIQFEFGPANIYSRTYFYDFWSILAERFDIFRIIPGGIVSISYYGEHREVFLTTNYLAIKKQSS